MNALVPVVFAVLTIAFAVFGLRAKRRSERFVVELGELAAARTIKCGFRMRKGSGWNAALPLGRLHLDSERIAVRPMTMTGRGFCVPRAEAHVRFSRILGMRGLQVMGEKVGFDVTVEDLDGLVTELEGLGWLIESRAP